MSNSHHPTEIHLDDRLVCDLELLLVGALAPLTGFMTQEEYESVLTQMSLPTGEVFPLPIVLPVSTEVSLGENLILKDKYGYRVAELTVTSIYTPDLEFECQQAFGTTDPNHPSVPATLARAGSQYVGGPVKAIDGVRHYDFKDLRLTPEQTRHYFQQQGWSRVVGFQTRNPMHRSHYELTQQAMKDTEGCLFLQPVVGPTQVCDVDYHTRVRCYQRLLNQYPQDRVKLGLLPLAMRMAGPREAVLHALIRRNYGCTHFIVGRDHAGPSSKQQNGESFYGPYEAQELLASVKDRLGIEILTYPFFVYLKSQDQYLPLPQVPEGEKPEFLSGTELRRRLRSGEEIPDWYSFPGVIEELKRNPARGICIYLVGLSGAGKTTIAQALIQKIKELTPRPVTLLDGDVIRKNLSKGLGFSKEDRSTNVRRIGYLASEIVKHNGIVVAANIAPYEEDRQANRALISSYGTYLEVFVDTPLEVCEKRDTKGLYQKARAGIIKQFTGISDPFEAPNNAEVVVTSDLSVDQSLNLVLDSVTLE